MAPVRILGLRIGWASGGLPPASSRSTGLLEAAGRRARHGGFSAAARDALPRGRRHLASLKQPGLSIGASTQGEHFGLAASSGNVAASAAW